ncbi:hypothetical protein BSYN_02300 [Bacteroides sedimenti]|uniref:VWFA domain-containing protein n=2 Tax=Bacteroides sedimenti TaxID=2136147 RepID=A0ABM8I766_9BACE
MASMKKILSVCMVLTFLLGCGNKNINPDHYTSFDNNGALKEIPSPEQSLKVNHIKCFIESSGSMSGFFQTNKSTDFKVDVWAALNEFNDKIDSVFLFKDASEPVSKMALADFRRDMNAGNFKFAGSTHIPQMLKQVIQSLGKNDVGVFISDMKYSPMGSQADVLLTQYATDIKNVLQDTPYAFSIIGLTSAYISGKGKVIDNSPYYIILIGNDLSVCKTKQKILQSINKKNLMGELSFYRREFTVPTYTLLPNKGMTNGVTYESANNLFYTIGDIGKKSPVTFYLAADFSKLPYHLVSNGKILMQQLVVKAEKGRAAIEEVTDSASFDFGNGNREPAEKVHATHFIKIRVSDVLDGTTQLTLYVNRNEPSWYTSVCGAKSEAEYDKTSSFEQLLTGIKGAYNADRQSKYYYDKPFVVLISEGKR